MIKVETETGINNWLFWYNPDGAPSVATGGPPAEPMEIT